MNKNSLWAYMLCCLFIVSAASLRPRWKNKHSNATISWDVAGYYSYLPGAFIYKDLAQLEFLQPIAEKYNPTPGYINASRHPNGNYVIQYTSGQALMYLPAFVVAHTVASFSAYPADGYSYPYQFCLSWWSILIAFLGLYVVRKILLKYFSDNIVAAGLLLLVLGTNYLNYTAFDHAMTHNYLFTIYALLIFFCEKLYQTPKYRYALAVGGLIGLAALIRPTELIAVFIPLLWGISKRSAMQARVLLWKRHYPKILAAFVLAFCIGCIQFAYWKTYTGDFVYYSYEGQTFSWLSPHVFNVLFSFRKGWFIYTPMMLLAIAGLVPLYKKYKPIFWAIAVFTLLNIYIVSAWDIWWYGGSLGQRALVQSYAMLLFPLCALVEYIFQHQRKVLRYGVALFMVFSVAHNLVQTYQAQHPSGILEATNMTPAYYKRIFLNPNPADSDRFLLDIKTDYRGKRKEVVRLLKEDFEHLDSVPNAVKTQQRAYAGKWASYTNKEVEKSHIAVCSVEAEAIAHQEWMRVGAQFYCEWKEWNTWKMPLFVAQLYKNGELVLQKNIRPHRVFFEKRWAYFNMDFPLPAEGFDEVRVFLWNPNKSPLALYIDDVEIETYKPM